MPVSPHTLSTRFRTSDLVDQFILTRDPGSVPGSWSRWHYSDWILGTHPSLDVTPLAGAGALAGWIAGAAIDPDSRTFVFGRGSAEPLSCTTFDAFERMMDRLTGRFVAFLFSREGGRVYIDAAGSQSVVFCPSQSIVAASLPLIPYDAATEDDSELVEAMCIPESQATFAFGLTPRRGISRLLPNHYLGLERWRAVRHWPVGPIPDIDPSAFADIVASNLEGTIAAVCGVCEPYMSLTAGIDSRMLLACARKHVAHIRFFTWQLPDDSARVDVRIARELARREGLRHEVFPFHAARTEDSDEWLYRTGCAVGEPRGQSLASTVKRMQRQTLYMPGLLSEVGRLRGRVPRTRDGDLDGADVAPEDLAERLLLPTVPRVVSAARQWLEGLPVRRATHMLDLAHIEQRGGCWAGVTAYAEADGPFRMLPFANRQLLASMMGLPDQYRMAERLSPDVIRLAWPELLTLPFNPPDNSTAARARRRARAVLSQTPILWRWSKYV